VTTRAPAQPGLHVIVQLPDQDLCHVQNDSTLSVAWHLGLRTHPPLGPCIRTFRPNVQPRLRRSSAHAAGRCRGQQEPARGLRAERRSRVTKPVTSASRMNRRTGEASPSGAMGTKGWRHNRILGGSHVGSTAPAHRR
jgi:hypothetical protein